MLCCLQGFTVDCQWHLKNDRNSTMHCDLMTMHRGDKHPRSCNTDQYKVLPLLLMYIAFAWVLLSCSFLSHWQPPGWDCLAVFQPVCCPGCRTYEIATRFWVVVICPIIKCLTVLEFSFILFDLCLFITIFNFILNYVLIVTFWIFTYHEIWILLIIYCLYEIIELFIF